VNDARTRRRSPLGRLALLLAAVLAMAAAGQHAFAQSPPRHGGGRGGASRMAAPHAAWAGRGPAFPPNRYGGPPGPGGYGPAGRWYAAPPAYARPAPSPAVRAWRRGAFLPPDYQGFVVQDYGRYHLRRPPFGYSWVQAGNELLLVSASTGMIFDVVPAY
jgi:Ni/Co efflux regulator RcnB